MKILLMRPPAGHYLGAAKPSVSLPLGLLYIAAVLKQQGIDVEVYDAAAADKASGKEGSDIIWVGDDWQTVKARIVAAKADVIGISCLFTVQEQGLLRAAELAKEVNAKALVVAGGHHVSVCYQQLFEKSGFIDLACVGEGEYTMLEVVKAFSQGSRLDNIPGLISRNNIKSLQASDIVPIKNLDELPLPAYELIDMEKYFRLNAHGLSGRPAAPYQGAERAVSLITSRGCPFNCVFCSVRLHMGRNWRAHSAEYVARHINMLADKYGIRHIHFEDDNLTLDIARFKKILSGVAAAKGRLTWDTPNGVRVDTLTKEVLTACRDSRCMYLIFGVESGDQRILNTVVGKRLDLNMVKQAAAWCKDIGIDTQAFYVIGFPGEAPVDIVRTIDFALGLYKESDVAPTVFVATPLPGTDLENKFRETGALKNALSVEQLRLMTYGGFVMDGGSFKAQDIKVALNRFYKGYKMIFFRNTLGFLFRKPWVCFKLLSLAINRKFNKVALFDIIMSKNSLSRV